MVIRREYSLYMLDESITSKYRTNVFYMSHPVKLTLCSDCLPVESSIHAGGIYDCDEFW